MRGNRKRPRGVKLELEHLENREAPSVTPWTTNSFEGSQAGSLPLNWSQWNSDGYTQFAVTASPIPTLSGSHSLSVTSGANGLSKAVSRTWLDETTPADVQVSAAVYVSSLIPAQVIARGNNLDTPDGGNGPSFYAVQLARGAPGPKLTLVKDVNGTETTLGSINAPNYLNNYWLEESLDVEGSTVRAQLFDPKTGEYLNSSGQWQTSQAWALTVIDATITGPGFVGVGRPASYVGTVTFDDFSVQTPAAAQSFDATPVGSLPDNWSQWGTNGGNYIAVANPAYPAPPGGPKALAIAPPQSRFTARAWLDSNLPANLSASAVTYLNTLTPAQVLERGSDLNSSTPNYYAVEVSRGMTVKLVKVIDGVETELASLTSTNYVQNIWVQETLGVSGSTLYAQVYRPDRGEYLNSSGGWQSTQTWALQAADNSLTGAGQAGVARPVGKEYVETNYFADFTTVAGMDAQNFDSSNALPSGWNQWSSDGKNNYFSVAVAPDSSHFLSADNVLESATVGSTVTTQIWDANDSLTNAQVSTALDLSSPMPAVQLIARGSALNTTTPSYYGLSVTSGENGPIVTLVRVNNGGSPQILAHLTSIAGYVNTPLWIQETLYVDGNNLRASVYRSDTGQYLDSDGLWQTLPTYVLNVTDSSAQALASAGYGGLSRSGNSGTVYLDNFAVIPLSVDSTPPSLTIAAPSGTLTGNVTITATPTITVPGYNISKVEFYVDGVLNWVATASPYTWDFDTSSVANGTHTLLVKAYDDMDNIGAASATVTTSNNTTLTMPSGFPSHQQNSVGIAELDYGGNNYDPTLLQNDVDVVVPVTQDLAAIHSYDSSVQQLIYTNVSNIYSANYSPNDPLLSWLNYAETNHINPENAFYHVSVATPYAKGSTASTHPVDQFWQVYDEATGTDDTSVAYSGGSIAFGGVGKSVDIGYLEPFWEINFALTSDASNGWSGVLEYPTAVDSSGKPTAWAALTPLSDTTAGLLQSGQITFNPPRNWVPASIDGSAPLYYVRVRTVTAGTAPVADTIKGDNYTNSPAGSSGASGVIPAYDWALDPNGTGYLDPQEYAIAAAAGYTARFAYQSRLIYKGPMRFYTNPSNPEFKTWALTYYPNILKNTPYANGFFVDNSQANPPGEDSIEHLNIAGNSTTYKIDLVEPTNSYSNDYATLLNEIGQQIAPSGGWIMANTNGSILVPGSNNDGQTYADAVVSKVQAYYEEFGLRAVSDNVSEFLTLYNKVYYRATNDNPGYAVIDSMSSGGSEQDGQTQLTTLAAYYLLAPSNPSKGALDFYGGESTSSQWVQSWSPPAFNHWSQAATYNVGTPVNALPATPNVFQTGTEADGSTYYVFARQFTGQNSQPVLVLYKPISSSGAKGSSTATTVTLNGSYYVLQADGTLSSTAQASISLENGEGAILVAASGSGASTPALESTTMVAASLPTISPTATSPTQSTSAISANRDNPASNSPEQLTARIFDGLVPGLFLPNTARVIQAPMPQPADPFVLWADPDHFFSAWVTAKLLKAQSNYSPPDESVSRGPGSNQ